MTPNENTQAEREALSDAESRMLTFLFSNMEGLSDKDWYDHGFRLSTFNGLERKARAALSAPPAVHAGLMRFYAVDSADALIAAQAEHIEKLQSKLQPAPSFAPQRVREG